MIERIAHNKRLFLIFPIAIITLAIWLAGCAQQAGLPPAPEASPLATPTPPPTPSPTPTQAPTAESEEKTARVEDLTPLPPTGEVDGIPVGFTQDGHAYLGNPNADVILVEYSDFQCPFCARHERSTAPQLRQTYLQSGKVLLIFRDFPLESIHPQARKAAEAARCAGEQGAVQFWAMHDLLFQRASQWADQADAVDRFKSYARELGLDADAFDQCLDSGRMSAAIDADLAAGEAQGIQGTPSFFLNGYPIVGAQPFERFQTVIDAMLAGNPPPTPESAQPRLPYWITAEGMSPDPERPGYTKAGDAYRGDPNAEVLMIEFADFQCPFCKSYVQNTEPQILREYVETGLVRVIYKHFPIPIHKNAPLAGAVAECAGQQGKFWEMHDRLFATQGEWSGQSDPQSIFDELAQEIGLDMEAYQACLDDPQVMDKITSDFDAGRRVGIRGTPNFIVLKGDRGQLIPGALPYEQFKQVLDAALALE